MLEGLAQDFQLNLPYILRRAEQLHGYREIAPAAPKSFTATLRRLVVRGQKPPAP